MHSRMLSIYGKCACNKCRCNARVDLPEHCGGCAMRTLQEHLAALRKVVPERSEGIDDRTTNPRKRVGQAKRPTSAFRALGDCLCRLI